jgi:hypothetical protein
MTDKRQPGVLGSLPRTRPHRRSAKRPAVAARAAAADSVAGPGEITPEAKRTKAKPRAASLAPHGSAPAPPPAPGTLQTAVQAAAELAEIGLQASARLLRRTLSRLPRP